MSIQDDGVGREAPTTKAGWHVFVSRDHPTPPDLLNEHDRAQLDPVEEEIYDDRRRAYHAGLLLVYTPQIQQVTNVGMKRIRDNQGKDIGRKGLAVLGHGGTGKSTSITQLGRRFQRDLERRSAAVTDRIPVVYITTPADPDPKKLAMELAGFLGLPFSGHEGPHEITRAVTATMQRARVSLILIDEIHRVRLDTPRGAQAADQLKYLFDNVKATFVYAGVEQEMTLFTGPGGAQFASRFVSLHTSGFGNQSPDEQGVWLQLVAAMESSLRLHRHKPGTLTAMADYLHRRTGGMIGSLDQLIYEAANDAIDDGTEHITRKHLDAVILDTVAQQQFDTGPSSSGSRERGRTNA